MFWSLLLLTLCSLVVGQAIVVPPHRVLAESIKRGRNNLNHPNPALVVDREFTREVDQAPVAPVAARPIYGSTLLTLAPGCYEGFQWQRIWIPVNKCYNITEAYYTIKRTPLCPDGGYAKLAFYDDDECNSMTINTPFSSDMTDRCLRDVRNSFGRPGDSMNSLKVLCKASPEYDKSLTQNATVKLFTALTKQQESLTRDSCTGVFNLVSLAPETCLSGDYYPAYNILVSHLGRCADGRLPTLYYYYGRNCYQWPAWPVDPGVCIWEKFRQLRYWSMVWTCSRDDEWTPLHYQAAIAPPALHPDPPRSALVVPYSSPDCTWQDDNGPIAVPVSECLAISGYGLQVLEPAVCKDGTRAQWTRFGDDKCNNTKQSPYSRADLYDKDLQICLKMGDPEFPQWRVRSVQFWCDELHPSEKAATG